MHNLGLDSCRWFSRWWLRFEMIYDLLNYAWIINVGNNPHGAAAYWAQGNIKPIAARSKTRLSGSPSRR